MGIKISKKIVNKWWPFWTPSCLWRLKNGTWRDSLSCMNAPYVMVLCWSHSNVQMPAAPCFTVNNVLKHWRTKSVLEDVAQFFSAMQISTLWDSLTNSSLNANISQNAVKPSLTSIMRSISKGVRWVRKSVEIPNVWIWSNKMLNSKEDCAGLRWRGMP